MKTLKTFFKTFIVICALVLPYPTYSTPHPILKLEPYLQPMTKIDGSRYCSSVALSFFDKVYTVTNRHCCEASTYIMDLRLVNGSIEKILHMSDEHDVCILTSKHKTSPIRMARRDVSKLDKVLLAGYPRGTYLTPRDGRVVALNIPIRIGDTKPSHFISTTSYPGNSGSPVFDKNGNVVGLLYGGQRGVYTMGITVPHRYIIKALLKVRYGL